MHAGLDILVGQAEEGHLVALPVHDHQRGALRGHEAVFGERPRVAVLISVADLPDRGRLVRPGSGIDHADGPGMLALAVPGREARHHLVGTGNRLGVDHHGPGMLVAVPDHLGGAVGVLGPEMVVVHLAAIHVFPAGVKNPSVGERPGRIVLLVVARDRTDVVPVAVAAVHDGHLGQPAIDPPLAAGGHEDDVAVGQVGRLEIIIVAVGELAQARAVGADFEEMVGLGSPLAIAEEDCLAVVADLGIANAAPGIVEQRDELAGRQAPLVKLGSLAPGLAAGSWA